MRDLSSVDLEIECKTLDKVEPCGPYRLGVSLDRADMTDFIEEYKNEILDFIGEDYLKTFLGE